MIDRGLGCDAGTATAKQRDVIVRGAYLLVRVPCEHARDAPVVAAIRACTNPRSIIY